MATKKIRVYELARELGVENQVVLDLAEELKIGVKSHSSSIDDPSADRVRRLADSKGLRGEPIVDEPKPKAAPKKAKPEPAAEPAVAPAAGRPRPVRGPARPPRAVPSTGGIPAPPPPGPAPAPTPAPAPRPATPSPAAPVAPAASAATPATDDKPIPPPPPPMRSASG